MALNTRLAALNRNAQLDGMRTRLNSGYLRIYDGTQPTDPDTAITTQVKLAELRFGATAFPAASGGVITANAITSDNDAAATGTATWYRCFQSDGTTAEMDGSVGTATSNLVMASTSIVQHAVVSVSAFTHTLPMQGA